MTWTTLVEGWKKLRASKLFWPLVGIIVALLIFGFGFWTGHRQVITKTETHTVVDTESKQKLVEALQVQQQLHDQLDVAEKKIVDLNVHRTEKVSIVYLHDGTKVVEKECTTDVARDTTTTKDTAERKDQDVKVVDNKQVDTATATHMDTKTVTTVMPKDNFYLGLAGEFNVTGFNSLGLEFKYRLLDLGKASVWAGANVFVVVPPTQLTSVQAGLSLGTSF